MRIINIARYLGLTAALTAWITIYTSIYYNPWFNLFKHALSDLGTSDAFSPWIYNYGLILTGLILMLYSPYLVYISRNKIEAVGGGYVLIGGLFLILIGIFPGGTRPHVFVSTYFFIQMGIAILTMGIGSVLDRRRLYSLSCILIFILMLIGGFIDWPSVAIQEIYEVILLNIWVLIRTFDGYM